MNENSIRTKVRRARHHVVTSGYPQSYAHFLPADEPDQWGFGGRTVCGAKHRSGRWQGIENSGEIADANTRELCPRCVKTALIQGLLD